MPAGKNYNIVTKRVSPGYNTNVPVAVGSSVAVGMTRYVTMVRVEQNNAAQNLGAKLWLCSTSTSAKASTPTLASAAKKLTVKIVSNVGAKKVFQIPEYPDTENPLFTIAASRFLTVVQASTGAIVGNASCAVFVQYYDQ